MAPLAISEAQGHGWGYIYILRSLLDLGTLSVLKIGFSKYHPEHRAHELGSCLTNPDVVAHTPLIPHAKRVESLIHTELVAIRKVQRCGQCGQQHREWFTISHAESREIVIRWSKWILKQPYLDGKLSDAWRTYLEQQDYESARPEATVSELWTKILDNFPRKSTDSTPEEQLGAYINACYFANLSQKVVGPELGSSASFLKTLQDRRHGTPMEIGDYMSDLSSYISSQSNTTVNPDHINLSGISTGMRDYLSAVDNIITSQYKTTANLDTPARSESVSSFAARLHEFNAWKKDQMEQFKALKDLKTGAMSVCDPVLGVTESPLGDATLLPVVSLRALKQMDAPARSWIGYNPTHQGFQLLQEAYQRGEWVGNAPQFKLPKAFRKAGVTKLPATTAEMADEGPSGSAQPTSSRKQSKESLQAQKTTDQASGIPSGNTVRYTCDEHGDTLEFSAKLNDDFIKQVNEVTELLKFPLGRALVEKEALKAFQAFGYNFSGDYEFDGLSSSSSSSSDEMEIDEQEDMQPETTTRVPGTSRKERVEASHRASNRNSRSGGGLSISKAEARRWLDSI